VYVAGTTSNGYDRIPTTSRLHSGRVQGQRLFLTKLASGGNVLVFSTLLPGIGSGVVGWPSTPLELIRVRYSWPRCEFPATARAFQNVCNSSFSESAVCSTLCTGHAAVIKLKPDGSSLLYATYLAGTGSEVANGML